MWVLPLELHFRSGLRVHHHALRHAVHVAAFERPEAPVAYRAVLERDPDAGARHRVGVEEG